MTQKAIVIGASGLIGSNVVTLLLEHTDFEEVLLIVRKPMDISHSKIKQLIVDFDNLNLSSEKIQGDVIFSCLGTTKSESPNPAQYRKVDFIYPLELAQIGLENGIKQFHIVSSLGANSSSSSSYLKLKGELENELSKLNFVSLHIYQPSYITGERVEKRIDDKIMKPLIRLIDPLLVGGLDKYKSISAITIAKSMINQAVKNHTGTFTYPSNKIKNLA